MGCNTSKNKSTPHERLQDYQRGKKKYENLPYVTNSDQNLNSPFEKIKMNGKDCSH